MWAGCLVEKAWLPGREITLKLSDLAWSLFYVSVLVGNVDFFVKFSFAEHHWPVLFEGLSKISRLVSVMELDGWWRRKETKIAERGKDQGVITPNIPIWLSSLSLLCPRHIKLVLLIHWIVQTSPRWKHLSVTSILMVNFWMYLLIPSSSWLLSV